MCHGAGKFTNICPTKSPSCRYRFHRPSGKHSHHYGQIHQFLKVNPLFLWALVHNKQTLNVD